MSILKIEDDNPSITALRQYVTFHESLTVQTASLSAKYFDDSARYQAPMNDIQGRRSIAEHWVEHREMFDSYKLKAQHVMWTDEGQTAFVRWDILGVRQGRKMSVSGVAEITFTLQGKIISHIDYYDPLRAYLYDVPMLGGLLKSRHKSR